MCQPSQVSFIIQSVLLYQDFIKPSETFKIVSKLYLI